MDDSISDEVGYVDNGREVRGDENDLEDIGQSTTVIINIDTAYQPSWGPAEGFRENYQNWKDAIMRSFGISERDFKVEQSKGHREKLYRVYHPIKTPKHLVGFIRFTYDVKNLGTLEFVNFKASLQQRHLGIGGTSKANHCSQMGQHGEGLKLSALVNRRHPYNYSFVITSNSFRWTFGWNVDKKLNCRLQRLPKTDLREQKELAAQNDERNLPRECKARAWEDVSIVIGEPRHGRTLTGDKQTSNKIPLKDFLTWTIMTIDIDPPSNVVRTDHGDLILHPNHRNKIYLHSLLLPSGSKSGKPFAYGYNLLNGETGRDRDTVATARTEAEHIAKIWAAALTEEKRVGKEDLISKYAALILGKFHRVADVDCIGGLLSKEIAELVWDFLKKSKPWSNQSPFYYCGGQDSQGAEIIKRRLDLYPISLDADFRKLLRAYNLCSTPQEECIERFKRAKTVDLEEKPFPQHIIRGLRSLMTLDALFKDKQIVPVEAGKLGIVISHHGGEFKIDQRWFTYEGAHESSYCEHSAESTATLQQTFVCDHIILFLWDNMISMLQKQSKDQLGLHPKGNLKSIGRAKLQQLPRAVKTMANEKRDELLVSWTSMEPMMNTRKPLRVTLHSPTCKSWSFYLSALVYKSTAVKCGCPVKISTVGSGRVTFTGIKRNTQFLPMVSRDEDNSLYGFVAASVSPLSLQTNAEPKVVHKSPLFPSFMEVSTLFNKPPPNEWSPLSYDVLFRDSFPYSHTWISARQSGSHVLIAKSKSEKLQADLKRAIEDDPPTARAPKKPYVRPNGSSPIAIPSLRASNLSVTMLGKKKNAS